MVERSAEERFWGLDATRGEARTALFVAVGLGILLGSTWVSRLQDVFGWDALLPLARVAAALWLCGLAVYYRRRRFDERHLLLVGVLAFAAHAACLPMSPLVAEGADRATLGFVSAFFEGAFIAVVELLFLVRAAGDLPPKGLGIAVAGAFLVGCLYDTLFLSAFPGVIAVQWVVAKAVCLGLLFALARGPAPAKGSAAIQGGRVETRRQEASTPPVPDDPAAPTPYPMPLAALLFALILVLMLVQGVASQMTGLGGVGERGFYGLSTGFIVLVVRVLTVVYCAARKRDVPFASPVVICSVVWVAALGLTALTWADHAGVAGALLLEAGYSVLQVLPLIAALQHAGRGGLDGDLGGGGSAVTVAALMAAVSFANQPSRFVATLLFDRSVPQTAVIDVFVYVSMTLIGALVAALCIVVLRRTGPPARNGGAGARRADVLPEDPDDPLVQAELSFCRRYRSVCKDKGLTPREQEVLFEAVHGYTIDHIALRLSISRETVKTTLSKSYARAGVSGKQAFLQLMDKYGGDEG